MYQPEQQSYWKRTRLLAWITLANLVLFGLVVVGFVNRLDQVTVLDFSLGYFLAAQGSLTALAILSFWFSFFQRRVDREFGLLDDD